MDINSQYDQLTYDEKLKFYSRNLSSGSTMSGKLEDKLKLIHLIYLVTFKMRDKEKDIKSKEVLERLMGIKLDVSKDGYTNYLIGLSLLCDDLLFEITEISTLGYTNSNDIINEIKRLIDGWIPF